MAKKTRRLSIDLVPAAAQEVDQLRELTGLTTAELFRYAFTLLRIYIRSRCAGQELHIVDPERPNELTRLELPISVPHRSEQLASSH